MIRICDGTDPNLTRQMPQAEFDPACMTLTTARQNWSSAPGDVVINCQCGKRFDDTDYLATYPHRAVYDPALEAEAAVRLVNHILRALCERDGLSVESEVEPGKPARNYELADRLGIGLAQPPYRFATGGIVRSSSPGDDSIPAFLSEGCAPIPGELGRWLNQPVPFASRPPWYARAWYRADDAARRLRRWVQR